VLRLLILALVALLGSAPVTDDVLRSLSDRVASLERESVRSKRLRDAHDADRWLGPRSLSTPIGIRGSSAGGIPDLASPLMARLRDDASLPGLAGGRVDTGYPNLLIDPLFETVSGGTLSTSYGDLGVAWEGKYTLTSGTAPTVTIFEQSIRGDASSTVYGFENSVNVEVYLNFGSNAGAATGYLRSANAWTPSALFLPSWLVASVRIFPVTIDTADLLTASAVLQIVDGSDVVVAESDSVDLLTVTDLGEPVLLETALEGPDSAVSYRWRLAVTASKGAGVTPDVLVTAVDPFLAYSDDGSVHPFSPAVGPRWPALTPIQVFERITDQTISDATDTAISWNAAIGGSGDIWSSSPNPTRIYAPYSGLYLISCRVRWKADATGYRLMWVTSGGVDYARDWENNPSGSRSDVLQSTLILPMTAGDYARVLVHQTSGAGLDVVGGKDSMCSVALLRPGAW
jgi:hypothetical protein